MDTNSTGGRGGAATRVDRDGAKLWSKNMKALERTRKRCLTLLILVRWIDIFFLTAISILIVAYIQKPIIDKLSVWIENVGTGWHPEFALILYSIIPIAFCYWLNRIGGFRWKDLNLIYSWSNPPTWYCAVLVLCIFPICSNLFDTGIIEKDLLPYYLAFWGILFLPLTALGLISKCTRPYDSNEQYRMSSQPNTNNLEMISSDPQKLIEWLQKEQPIELPDEDLFDAVTIANRIAERLLNDPPENIAFIGNYGSGKTSVLNLVRYILERNNSIVLSVSGWAFEDGNFTNHILTHIMKKISKETDCVSAALLPIKFQNTFMNLDLGLFNFCKLFLTFDDPNVAIKKLNDILVRSQRKLAIFIEDIDRNNSPNFDKEVYSLFNYFGDQNNISFVITHGGII